MIHLRGEPESDSSCYSWRFTLSLETTECWQKPCFSLEDLCSVEMLPQYFCIKFKLPPIENWFASGSNQMKSIQSPFYSTVKLPPCWSLTSSVSSDWSSRSGSAFLWQQSISSEVHTPITWKLVHFVMDPIQFEQIQWNKEVVPDWWKLEKKTLKQQRWSRREIHNGYKFNLKNWLF